MDKYNKTSKEKQTPYILKIEIKRIHSNAYKGNFFKPQMNVITFAPKLESKQSNIL